MELCMWCDKLAMKYCDAVIGFEATGAYRDRNGNVAGLLTSVGGKMWTCDAPICAEHARQIGQVCGGDADSIDHCPDHTAHQKQEMKELVMFEDEAAASRRKVYAEIRRDRMRIERSNVK